MTSTNQNDNKVRLAIVVAAFAVLPLFVGLSFKSTSSVNGVITEYSYFGLTDIVVGLAGIVYAVRQRSTARVRGNLTPKVKFLLVLLLAVSVFQIVRGSGVVPATTDCTAGYSFDLCKPAAD
ncbi:hypothetical protein [Streptomyces sp. NPDC020996]|uniref:hypothetical protein n=1 Tax=Streptomyces sp. NPDC020996 TaxID=3154791 RepID=UPI0033C34DFC